MKESSIGRFTLVSGAISFLLGVGLVWVLAGPACKFSADVDWPAWVQAVGSVVAIFVAVIVPLRMQRQAKIEKDAEAKLKARSLAAELVNDLSDLTAAVHVLQEDAVRTLGDVLASDIAFQRTKIPDVLKHRAAQLHELGSAGATLQLVVLELTFLRSHLLECRTKASSRDKFAIAAGEAKRSLDAVAELLEKAAKQLGDLFDN